MKQLDFFSLALEDQIYNLKQGEAIEFFRGKERLLIRKHEKYQGICFYQAEGFSGYALHVDEMSGLDMFTSKIKWWLEGGARN
ncbi:MULTISPECIES: hypothetical protein [Cytobacillus]|uniref:hypothetical protein n=1 Tax=Cytobacillus TaxID=2675230 RepID=UPI0024947A36|nr:MULTISPECIES: hypothetical protein [Cytobacillus]